MEHEENAELEEGMVTTDEPGLYIEGSHGIRIENELLCRKGEENEYGQFMYFEDLTCVPIDLDAVDNAYLEAKDKETHITGWCMRSCLLISRGMS